MEIYIIKSIDGKETHYFPESEYEWNGGLFGTHTFRLKNRQTGKEVHFYNRELKYQMNIVESYKIDDQ